MLFKSLTVIVDSSTSLRFYKRVCMYFSSVIIMLLVCCMVMIVVSSNELTPFIIMKSSSLS